MFFLWVALDLNKCILEKYTLLANKILLLISTISSLFLLKAEPKYTMVSTFSILVLLRRRASWLIFLIDCIKTFVLSALILNPTKFVLFIHKKNDTLNIKLNITSLVYVIILRQFLCKEKSHDWVGNQTRDSCLGASDSATRERGCPF